MSERCVTCGGVVCLSVARVGGQRWVHQATGRAQGSGGHVARPAKEVKRDRA